MCGGPGPRGAWRAPSGVADAAGVPVGTSPRFWVICQLSTPLRLYAAPWSYMPGWAPGR